MREQLPALGAGGRALQHGESRGAGGRGAGGGTATGPGPRAWLLHVLWGSLSERFASLSLRLLICRVTSAGFHSLFVFTRHRAP